MTYEMMFVACANTPASGFSEDAAPKRKLSNIVLVEQPRGSLLCGAACIKMAENYFFNESNTLDYIFDQVSLVSVRGRKYNATYKMGSYLENRDLLTSIVKFSNLKKVLDYCEANQIPALMNIQDVSNPLLGHFIVFAGYNSKTDLITVRDPLDPGRKTIKYNDLEKSFVKTSSMSELGGNTMVIPNDIMINKLDFLCGYCGKNNVIDGEMLSGVMGLICNNCDHYVSVR